MALAFVPTLGRVSVLSVCCCFEPVAEARALGGMVVEEQREEKLVKSVRC
jgi:hypothetical protein